MKLNVIDGRLSRTGKSLAIRSHASRGVDRAVPQEAELELVGESRPHDAVELLRLDIEHPAVIGSLIEQTSLTPTVRACRRFR
jgi:hypothetical protein